MSDFRKKTVVITGGSRGIGRACCLAFAQKGANVAFTYFKSKEKADQLEKEIVSLGVKCLNFQLDVRDYDQCQRLAEEALEKFGRFDILINNAGIIKDKALMMMSKDEWREVIDTNLNGVFNVTKSFIVTFMKQKQGQVINIASVSGIIGLPRQTNYAASKGGIISFTKSLSREVGQFNIRVNAIAPGFIETDMLNGLSDEYIKDIMPSIPLRRLGKPEEVAKAVLFIASEDADYISGQVIRVDGGLGM